jgi:hypothetical protein
MKLINFSLILFFLALYQVDSFAQVVVHTDGKVMDLLEKHVTINKNHEGKLIGFCVQICFESGNDSRKRAEDIRRIFLSKYPKTSAYLSYKEANFRVKVGDFRTRVEARGFRKEILTDFPQAFVLKDEIKYPKHIFEITE